MAALEIEGLMARRRPAEGMAGGIAGRIGLGLDDAPAGPSVGMLADQQLADEKAGQRRRADRQLRARQARLKRDGFIGASDRPAGPG